MKTPEFTLGLNPALERRLERLGLSGTQSEWLDRYLLCNHLLSPAAAEDRQKFEATSRFIRDHDRAPLGQDPAGPPGEPAQAGALPVDGVPARAHPAQAT